MKIILFITITFISIQIKAKSYSDCNNLSNEDEYDINMLAMPGVVKQYHSLVANAGIDMCEERGDTFFVMDLAGKDSSINNAVLLPDPVFLSAILPLIRTRIDFTIPNTERRVAF